MRQTFHLALLAESLKAGGQIDEGLAVAAEALAVVEATGERFYEAELRRLRGELLLLQAGAGRPSPAESAAARPPGPDPSGRAEAEACFRRALTIARGQQAKSLELRAVMSLTRLYQKQDRPAEVRPMLAECYDWFTEGFDTLDLQEAKALLEQVS
jgi:predicted ATPase